MSLSRINISGIRNLSDVELRTEADLIFIQGDNGSGKTSLIEALYLLGRGSSFRSSDLDRVVHHDKDQFVCFGLMSDQRKLGISRNKKSKQTRVRIDGITARSLSELASQIPLLLVTPMTFDLLNGAPAIRRRFLDWGVFHVEPEYKTTWQQWRKLLLQRNKLLKTGRISDQEIKVWNSQFARLSEDVDRFRRGFFEALSARVTSSLEASSDFTRDLARNVEIYYERGWNRHETLDHLLECQWQQDLKRGFTGSGPHKADIRFNSHGVQAKEILSRGQQKVLVTHLLLAQLDMLKEKRQLECLVLIDDLTAELDKQNQQSLIDTLLKKQAQLFVTVVSQEEVLQLNDTFKDQYNTLMFHVEQGVVSPRTPG